MPLAWLSAWLRPTPVKPEPDRFCRGCHRQRTKIGGTGGVLPLYICANEECEFYEFKSHP